MVHVRNTWVWISVSATALLQLPFTFMFNISDCMTKQQQKKKYRVQQKLRIQNVVTSITWCTRLGNPGIGWIND